MTTMTITYDGRSKVAQVPKASPLRLYDVLGRLITIVATAADEQTLIAPYAGTYLLQIGRQPAVRIVAIR